MSDTRITVVYDDGSMTVNCPAWFYEERPHQRRFYKLLFGNQNRSENRQAAEDLLQAVEDEARAQEAAGEAEIMEQGKLSSTTKTRIKRIGQAKADISDALERYENTLKR